MAEHGIPTNKIGSRLPGQGHATFIPSERTGGGNGNDTAGGLTVDSGVFNPDLLVTLPGSKEWENGRLRDRLDAAIAHEHEEARRDGDHVEALKHAPGRHRTADQPRRSSHSPGQANEGARTMIHELTIGHLDPQAPREIIEPCRSFSRHATTY
jgi:hypothetical protein